MSPDRKEGLRVLICGAASGIGLACAETFAARGAELILCDCDGTGLTRAAERLGAFSRFCDAIAETSVAAFAADVIDKFPNIDVLINAAGQGYVRSLSMTRLSQAMLPLLRRGCGQRLIINFAPNAPMLSGTPMFPHASSRAAFERLSDAVAEQTKGTQIGVVNIIPDWLRSEARDSETNDHFYRIAQMDVLGAAERAVAAVAERRPHWKQLPSPFERRA